MTTDRMEGATAPDQARPAARLRAAALELGRVPETPERLAAALCRISADLCVVQNVPVHDSEGWIRNLSEQSRLHAVLGPEFVLRERTGGTVLLTRWPVARRGFADLAIPPAGPCRAMDLDLETGGVPLRIVTVQLDRRRDTRKQQEARLAEILCRRGPALVLGRFSILGLARADDGAHGRYRALRWLPTLPGPAWRGRPALRIASFPAQPLAAVPLAPSLPTMVAFEITPPLPAREAARAAGAVLHPAYVSL